MRKAALWVVIIGIVTVFGALALLFQHLYFEARIDTQREEMQKEREVWLMKLEEALPPLSPEILYTKLTFDEVKQATEDGNLSCIGTYPLAGLDLSGDVMRFVLTAGDSFNIILLEKGRDVFPSYIQIGAPYTICRETNGEKRVVWVDSSSFNGVKPIEKTTHQ